MLEIAYFIGVVGFVTWMSLRTIKAHRNSRKVYPEIEYDKASAENTIPEKLQRPKVELGLTVDHIAEGTSVSIPSATRNLEVFLQLFGWFMISISVLGVGKVLFGFGHNMMVIAIPLAFLMGWSLLQVGRRIIRIEFRREAVIFVVQFGGLLFRKFSFPWQPEMEFEGQYQSVLTMTNEHKEPDYKITITRPRIWFLPWSRSFLLACNQSQGSWIVGALRSWADRKSDTEWS